VRDRIDFLPFARTEHAVWILSQMQRWGQLPREVDYRATAEATLMPALLDELTKEAGFSAGGRLPAGLEPRAPEGALEEMKRQPFSAFRPREAPPAGYAMGPAARARLGAILEKLAQVAGDGAEIELETTSEDEIGWLEHMLNETLKNLRFAREAQEEKLDLEEQALRQRAIIEAQERLIHELSTPILPVLEGVLVLPILGDVDEARGRKITEALLAAVCTARASLVLIDITGVLSVGREVVGSLVGMARAVALLGAECVLVGVSPSVAAAIAASGEDLAPAVTRRDLRTGIELAMQRRRERRVRVS
jgi:anti-anti-sigma regulatory factor